MNTFFEHLDYRELLRILIEKRQQKDPWFSYRWISQKIGVSSSGFLSLVLNSKRNISIDTAAKLSGVMNLSKRENDYFLTLVRFNQSTDSQEKALAFEELLTMRPSRAKSISIDQQEYFNHWYNAAIREMITIYGNDQDTVKCIAENLIPKVNKGDIKESLNLLERLGFIRKNEHGGYVQSDSIISSAGTSIDSSAIKKHHAEMIDLSKNALYNINKEERDISTVTLSTDSKGMELIKKRIEQCRSEIMSIAQQSETADTVLQFNVQLFPLCNKKGN